MYVVDRLSPLEVQREGIESVAGGDQYVLSTIEHIGLHGIGYLAQVCAPQRFSIRWIVGNQFAVRIAAEQHLSRGRGQPIIASSFCNGRLQMPPLNLAGLVIDGSD